MTDVSRTTIGAAAGALVAALVAPAIRPLFHPPSGGVGYMTVHAYPKAWDYGVGRC